MSESDPTSFEGELDEASILHSAGQADAAELGEPASPGDPTGEGEQFAETAAGIPAPSPGIPLPKRPVSGRYRGTLGAFQLELRVDVDRARPTQRFSGDFYQTTGGTTKHVGSFVVHAPIVTATATQFTLSGVGSFTFAASAPKIRITIPRRTLVQPQAPASVQFSTLSNSPGALYGCAFESSYFRTVRIETDRVSDVGGAFASYNTGALPSGGSARTLDVVKAFAEAGVQLVTTAASDVVPVVEAGASWSNAELHASMVRHFSLWRDLEQWSVWLLNARRHDLGTGLYGIMFDQQGKQRQGCAVFYEGIGGDTAEKRRLQLYTSVHELGHCFNLLHSWQKQYANPPVPNRINSLSWMNYPWGYPSGPAAFWNSFAFQFDKEEVIHLRHAFRKHVIMGGSDFIVGSALQGEWLADPLRDDSGLTLKIEAHQKNYALGEPVVLKLDLGTTHPRGRRVHPWLHPNCGLVKVVIRKPNGAVVGYEPLIDHLVGEREQLLSGDEHVSESAYIGYGKDGFYFDQPGQYRVRAIYAALDGSEVMSDVITVRVRYPVTATEESLADLFMGEDQGALLYLLGSDSPDLRRGNDAFEEVLNKYKDHHLASYARLVQGINANRRFKTIDDDARDRLLVREAHPERATALLTAATESGALDGVTKRMALETLAQAQTERGDEGAAQNTLNTLAALSNGSKRRGAKAASAGA